MFQILLTLIAHSLHIISIDSNLLSLQCSFDENTKAALDQSRSLQSHHRFLITIKTSKQVDFAFIE
jgi:hypothetical protein